MCTEINYLKSNEFIHCLERAYFVTCICFKLLVSTAKKNHANMYSKTFLELQ